MDDSFDFSHLAPKKKNLFDFSSLNKDEATALQPETENTFLGEMPRNLPEYKIGSEESKSLLKDMINSLPILGGLQKAVSTTGEKVIKPLFHKGSPQKTASYIQKGHDVLENESTALFKEVEDEAVKRGINKMPIPDKLISEAESYLPKTRASEELIKKAKTGEYTAIRKLQSDLRHRGELLKGSELGADRDIGEELLDLRDKINEEVANTFEVFGHSDLKDKLSNATSMYKNVKDIYFSHPVIANMVKKGLRKIPKNVNQVVTEISEPMKRIRE